MKFHRSPSHSTQLFGVLMILAAGFAAFSETLPMKEPRLTEEQGREKLAQYAATWHTREEWEQRAKNIRAGMLQGANLSPLPARCDLKPIIWGKRARTGYSVENVAFESLPGFFVTGNLYRPAQGNGPFPGILCPHGHGKFPRVAAYTQTRCAVLARMGAVVLAYDMVGMGDSTQTTHTDPNVLSFQLWDSIRALDFLASLPTVDPRRLACTGESGGGTQTFMLSAVDDRVAVSVPVVMVSAHFFGGCICESGLPIHHSDRHDTDNAEITALFAPKPLCVISDGDDWTRNVPKVEFPYIQSVYKLYGALDQVQNTHLPNERHDYGPSKREAMYRFMAKHLQLNLAAVETADGKIDESDTTLDPAALAVFTPEHARPAYALKDGAEVLKALKSAQKELSQ
jgi:dienelactone hydrolase